jgi:hypothetical protein
MNNVITDTYIEQPVQQSLTVNINSPIQQSPPSQHWAVIGAGVVTLAAVSGGVGYVVSISNTGIPPRHLTPALL